jgi:hypothetical protein
LILGSEFKPTYGIKSISTTIDVIVTLYGDLLNKEIVDGYIKKINSYLSSLKYFSHNKYIPYVRFDLYGEPKYKIISTKIVLHVSRGIQLKAIIEKIEAESLIINFTDGNWVGGLLSILDLPSSTLIGFRATITLSKPLRQAIEIIKDCRGSSGDKWDCQEELEKDKSTKPFASE